MKLSIGGLNNRADGRERNGGERGERGEREN